MKSTPTPPFLPLPGLVYHSEEMRQLAVQIHRLSQAKFPLLLLGESGTGKELVARAIHQLSRRHNQLFAAYNCAAIPEFLMEAQLFGHKKGAFTGAIRSEPGVLRTAHHGTVLLDEIGDLPLLLQPKLLRFLQEGEIQVVGESQPRKVDVRLIAATNKNLSELVAQKLFRDDLYHRLNTAELYLPPLRERRADIPLLLDHFLRLYSIEEDKPELWFEAEALQALLRYDWPGNVRELGNEVQRAVALAQPGQSITLADLSSKFQPPSSLMFSSPLPTAEPEGKATPFAFVFPPDLSLRDVQVTFEQALMRAALERQEGNLSRAAQELGWTRQTLRKKIKQYVLERPRKKRAPPKVVKNCPAG
jgi:hydrogenase-4 transcriptional activator